MQGRDSEAASGFLDEITLLNKLKGRSNIIQLIDSEVRDATVLYICARVRASVLLSFTACTQLQTQSRRSCLRSSTPQPGPYLRLIMRLKWHALPDLQCAGAPQ